MKTITKMEADFQSVTKYMEENPGASKKDAIAAVAAMENKSANTVLTNYYRAAKRNGATLLTRGPGKKAKLTKVTAKKKTQSNLDLNVGEVKASLSLALRTIEMLEEQNAKNEKIVNNLRSALSA